MFGLFKKAGAPRHECDWKVVKQKRLVADWRYEDVQFDVEIRSVTVFQCSSCGALHAQAVSEGGPGELKGAVEWLRSPEYWLELLTELEPRPTPAVDKEMS